MSRFLQNLQKFGPGTINQRSYFDAIKDGLPDLTSGRAAKIKTNDGTSPSYRLTRIPKAVVQRPVDHYEKIGFAYLDVLKDVLKQGRAPTAIKNEGLDESTEGTVVASFQQHVSNPINTALYSLQKNFDFTYKVKYEYASADSDHYGDVVFTIKTPTRAEEVFAVVELKNRGIIADALEPFTRATLTEDKAKNNLPAEDTLIKGSAKNLMNQATRYAFKFECPYIALFDWDNLILLDFEELPQALQQKTGKSKEQVPFAGNLAKITLLQEQTRMTNAVFGFVLQAMEAKMQAWNYDGKESQVNGKK